MRNLIDNINFIEGKIYIQSIQIYSDLSAILLIFVFYSCLYFIYKKDKFFFYIISFAYFIRVFVLIIGYYFYPLPDSLWDSRAIEYYANYNSSLPLNIIFTFNDTFFPMFQNLLSLIYKVSGRSPLVLLVLINLMSIISIIIISKSAFKIWNSRSAQIKCLILLSILPINILYSSVILKESIILLIMSLSIYMIINFVETKKHYFAYLSILIYILIVFFHAPLMIGIVPFIVYYFIFYQYEFYHNFRSGKITIYSIINNLVSILFIFFVINFSWEKVLYNSFLNANFFNQLVVHANNTFVSDASFPDYFLPENIFQLFYLLPIKIIYFLFSPFPWDITEPIHLFGLIDGLITLFIFYFLIKNIKLMKQNKHFLLLSIIFILILIVYTLGTGNFGTAIRHKYKFFFIIIILSSIFLPKIKLKY